MLKKARLNEILKKEEITKSFKDFKAGSILDKELLDKLNIKEYWKLDLKNKDTSNKVLQLKEQFNSAQKDIQLRFEDKVLKI